MHKDFTFQGPDGNFHCIDWGGSGPLTYMAHATGFCAGMYGPLAERLLPFLKVVGMDDRGHGRTEAPADPHTLMNWDIFVRDLERFLETFREPVIAIGHSRGGTVSMFLAVKRPDLIRALILLDPTILPYSWMWWWFLAKKAGLAKFVPIAYRAAKRRYTWPDREAVLKSYRGKNSFRLWKEGFLDAYVQEGMEEDGKGKVRWACNPAWESRCFATCPHDVWQYVPRVPCPTLLLYGAKSDTFLAPAAKRFKIKLPRAKLIALPETSHFVPMERPDETREMIFNFLREKGIR